MWNNSGYSEYDFMRMQQDAITRARDMNQRASSVDSAQQGSAPPQSSGWHNPNQSREEQHANETRCPRCGRIIRGGRHVYEARPAQGNAAPQNTAARGTRPHSANTAHAPPAAPPQQKPSADAPAAKISIPLLGDIELDRDFLLVGGLLLVLLAEDGDRILMLALLYIML